MVENPGGGLRPTGSKSTDLLVRGKTTHWMLCWSWNMHYNLASCLQLLWFSGELHSKILPSRENFWNIQFDFSILNCFM